MALIKCPECGRDNVSDTAETCPQCGYGIKKHFDKIREDQEKRKRQLEEELKQKNEYQGKLDKIQTPNKPHLGGLFYFSLIWIAFWIIAIKLTSSDFDVDYAAIYGDVFLIIIGIGLLIVSVTSLSKKKAMYALSQKDFIKYQETYLSEKEQKQAELEAFKESRTKSSPVCPVCGSKKTTRITTANRMVSVGMVGIASSQIGKQYKCLNCKHQW